MYFRGEAKKYDQPCTPTILRESEYDISFESQYYAKLAERFEGFPILAKLIKDCKGQDFYNLKVLGVFQHYGFNTRLLDVTKDENIAIYFASNSHFDENGYIYGFNEQTSKHIKTLDAQSIKRKMAIIQKYDQLEHTKVEDLFEKGAKIQDTISNNVIIDYNTVIKSEIGTGNDNLRLNRQRGAFLLFGNILDNDGYLTSEYAEPDFTIVNEIPSEEKFTKLIGLSFETVNMPISHVTLYPDDQDNMKIIAKYEELKLLHSRDEATFKRLFQNYIAKFFDKYEGNKPAGSEKDNNKQYWTDIRSMINEYSLQIILNRQLFYFVFREYADYAAYLNNKDHAQSSFKTLINTVY